MRTATTHIWMHDGRSLCDRQSDVRPRSRAAEASSDEQLESLAIERRSEPACGPCLLVAAYVRRLADELMAGSEGRVHPAVPSIGWAQLRDTRWAARLDLEELLARPELDTAMGYDAGTDAAEPQSLASARTR